MEKSERTEEDLIIGTTNQGPHGLIYAPVMLHMALLGALILGLIFGFLSFMMAEGSWAVPDFGQFAASSYYIAAITGGGVGVALGALVGGLIGINRVKKMQKNRTY